MYEELYAHSDYTPEMNSANLGVHTCKPEDPRMGSSCLLQEKGNKVSILNVHMLELRGQ